MAAANSIAHGRLNASKNTAKASSSAPDFARKIWRALTAEKIGYSPPTLIESGKQKQLVVWLSESLNGLDTTTGKVLWSFQTPSGIVGQPVTWEKNGKQYVTVMSGIGGVYALRAGDPNLVNVPAGASMWTFGLFDK